MSVSIAHSHPPVVCETRLANLKAMAKHSRMKNPKKADPNVLNAQYDALGTLYNLLNSYIAYFSQAREEGILPLSMCNEEAKRWRAENIKNSESQQRARIAIRKSGIEVPISWQPPSPALPTCTVETESPPRRDPKTLAILEDGWGKIIWPGVDASWAQQAQREIMASIETIMARRELLEAGEADVNSRESCAPDSTAAEHEAATMECLRHAIQRTPGGVNAKSSDILSTARVQRQIGLTCLRKLEKLGEYHGFSRHPATRHRAGNP